jgi:RsmE family RNA methyltransferase
MNMLLLDKSDFISQETVAVSGRRFSRLKDFIHIEPGKKIKAGVRNESCGSAEVIEIGEDLVKLTYCKNSEPPPAPPLTLIIALQRPQTFSKVIHSAVTLGIKNIHFIHTFKVEKSYWQSSRLGAENLQEEIDLALEQAGDPVEPRLFFHRRFKIFAEDELENIAGTSVRLFGDPSGSAPVPLPGTPITLALGPEGGFTDYEINTLKEHDFQPVSLGTRILRTEFALAALLGKLLF